MSGYPDPFGEILGPRPPTDKSDWSFTYACYADRTLEVPEMTLNSTGGETVGNITASDYFNETCLYNITYKEGKNFNPGFKRLRPCSQVLHKYHKVDNVDKKGFLSEAKSLQNVLAVSDL